jgi:hypothetical protein
MTALFSKISIKSSKLLLKPIKDVGIAIAVAATVAVTDPAVAIKATNKIEQLAIRTAGIVTAEATLLEAQSIAAKGVATATAEAEGVLSKMASSVDGIASEAQDILMNKLSTGDILFSRVDNATQKIIPFALMAVATGVVSTIQTRETTNCTLCASRNNTICTLLTSVHNKTGKSAQALTALESICSNVPNDANLLPIAQKLNTLAVLNLTPFLTRLASVLSNTTYQGIDAEFAQNTNLIDYFRKAENYDWAKMGLAAMTKKVSNPFPSKFVLLVNDYDVSVNNVNRRLANLSYFDDGTISDMGIFFDDWIEKAVKDFWQNGTTGQLSPEIISRLSVLKNDYVMTTQFSVSINGSNPKPDFLFIRKIPNPDNPSLAILDLSDCIYIDAKLLESTQFSAAQKQIVNNVTTTSGAIVTANDPANFGNNLIISENDPMSITRVEIFRISNDINLVNVLKAP